MDCDMYMHLEEDNCLVRNRKKKKYDILSLLLINYTVFSSRNLKLQKR